jgi:hypothetical protein
MSILLMAAKQGPKILFCMPDATNWILFISVMPSNQQSCVQVQRRLT